MLESIAIAALVFGGLSSAVVVSDDEAVAKQANKPAVVEVQKTDIQKTEAAKSPFLN
jgi:hypothetical protein